MKMKSISGLIYLVSDLEATKKFYVSLGFIIRKEMPGVSATAYLNWFWIEFLLASKVVSEELLPDAKVNPKGIGQYTHISVEDVDDFYEVLVQKGIKPIAEPQDRPWGHREFVISDPDGYKLVFFKKK